MEPLPSSSGRNMYPDRTASASGSNMIAFGVQAVEPAPSSSGRGKHFKKRQQVEVRANCILRMLSFDLMIHL